MGLEWDDVFLEGNSFGMAVGQPTFITDIDVKGAQERERLPERWRLCLGILLQVPGHRQHHSDPCDPYLSAPFLNQQSGDNKLNAMSGLIKTTFKF